MLGVTPLMQCYFIDKYKIDTSLVSIVNPLNSIELIVLFLSRIFIIDYDVGYCLFLLYLHIVSLMMLCSKLLFLMLLIIVFYHFKVLFLFFQLYIYIYICICRQDFMHQL